MLLEEFNALTGLNIHQGEDYAEAYNLVEKAYINCKENKFEFCKNLMADFKPYSQMLRCKHLDQTYCLWEFMTKIGYSSYSRSSSQSSCETK